MLEIIADSFLDTVKALPYLFGAYLLIEWLAHKAGETFKHGLCKLGGLGPVGGALLGLVPQCGFSVAAANFYADRIITPGTLAAVFISTSDEALPILLSNPDRCQSILPLLGVKFLFAVVLGLAVDIGLRRFWLPVWERDSELRHDHAHAHREDHGEEEHCTHTHCHGGIWRIALVHALKVSLLIFVITALLNLGLAALGEERTAAFLMHGSRFQPVLAALFGLVPSCAASVFLTQLYLEGSLTFGSVVAGLATGAGTGILVLCQACRSKKEAALILFGLFLAGAAIGVLIG